MSIEELNAAAQKLMKELAADVASAEEHAEFLADACSRLQENK
jgi:hypothetical protein